MSSESYQGMCFHFQCLYKEVDEGGKETSVNNFGQHFYVQVGTRCYTPVNPPLYCRFVDDCLSKCISDSPDYLSDKMFEQTQLLLLLKIYSKTVTVHQQDT